MPPGDRRQESTRATSGSAGVARMQSGRPQCGLVSGPAGFRGTLPSQQGRHEEELVLRWKDDDASKKIVCIPGARFERHFVVLRFVGDAKTRFAVQRHDRVPFRGRRGVCVFLRRPDRFYLGYDFYCLLLCFSVLFVFLTFS